jgi:hypothetical protein
MAVICRNFEFITRQEFTRTRFLSQPLFVSIGKLIKLKSLIDEAEKFKQRRYRSILGEGGIKSQIQCLFWWYWDVYGKTPRGIVDKWWTLFLMRFSTWGLFNWRRKLHMRSSIFHEKQELWLWKSSKVSLQAGKASGKDGNRLCKFYFPPPSAGKLLSFVARKKEKITICESFTVRMMLRWQWNDLACFVRLNFFLGNSEGMMKVSWQFESLSEGIVGEWGGFVSEWCGFGMRIVGRCGGSSSSFEFH